MKHASKLRFLLMNFSLSRGMIILIFILVFIWCVFATLTLSKAITPNSYKNVIEYYNFSYYYRHVSLVDERGTIAFSFLCPTNKYEGKVMWSKCGRYLQNSSPGVIAKGGYLMVDFATAGGGLEKTPIGSKGLFASQYFTYKPDIPSKIQLFNQSLFLGPDGINEIWRIVPINSQGTFDWSKPFSYRKMSMFQTNGRRIAANKILSSSAFTFIQDSMIYVSQTYYDETGNTAYRRLCHFVDTALTCEQFQIFDLRPLAKQWGYPGFVSTAEYIVPNILDPTYSQALYQSLLSLNKDRGIWRRCLISNSAGLDDMKCNNWQEVQFDGIYKDINETFNLPQKVKGFIETTEYDYGSDKKIPLWNAQGPISY